MENVHSLLDAIATAEDMLGRSLPYGPYQPLVFAALEELQEFESKLQHLGAAAELAERRNELGDEMVTWLEALENNPENAENWTALFNLREQWQNLGPGE